MHIYTYISFLRFWKESEYIYTSFYRFFSFQRCESLCFTPAINTTLYINSPSITEKHGIAILFSAEGRQPQPLAREFFFSPNLFILLPFLYDILVKEVCTKWLFLFIILYRTFIRWFRASHSPVQVWDNAITWVERQAPGTVNSRSFDRDPL